MRDEVAMLLGRWRTDPDDQWSLKEFGEVSLEFLVDGRLLYVVALPKKQQSMHLVYSVEGGCLVTDQPSHPRVQRTPFFFTPDGRLALENPPPSPPTFHVRLHDSPAS